MAHITQYSGSPSQLQAKIAVLEVELQREKTEKEKARQANQYILEYLALAGKSRTTNDATAASEVVRLELANLKKQVKINALKQENSRLKDRLRDSFGCDCAGVKQTNKPGNDNVDLNINLLDDIEDLRIDGSNSSSSSDLSTGDPSSITTTVHSAIEVDCDGLVLSKDLKPAYNIVTAATSTPVQADQPHTLKNGITPEEASPYIRHFQQPVIDKVHAVTSPADLNIETCSRPHQPPTSIPTGPRRRSRPVSTMRKFSQRRTLVKYDDRDAPTERSYALNYEDEGKQAVKMAGNDNDSPDEFARGKGVDHGDDVEASPDVVGNT